ncbi:MAG TPA: tryptophan halogenase family protein [Steroidobacteraceae bacterium]|nr:tryptophan halogenase family protein [Steroidobacteraceae bacterium]
MKNPIDDILFVGGGTAGWLTAAILAKRTMAHPAGGMRITVVESSDIPTVGVGEGTFPTIARTLAALGVDEAEFMRESGAAFKQGIRFVDWARPPEDGRHSHYYHPFALPRRKDLDLLPYWLSGEAGEGVSFADAVTLQEKVCDAGRAPKRVTDAEFRGPMNYAYHLDAARFGAYLRKVAISMGVTHRIATVERVDLAEDGSIAAVSTREHGRITADLYIDCTGFRSELLGRAMGVPFNDKNDVLFVDRAVAVQVPHRMGESSIPPYTISTAHEAGWTWDIALAHRRGVGYVYSSRHTSAVRAEAVLRDYAGRAADEIEVRHLKLQVGWRAQHWVKNCVAVGLSGGFLEPLESTGIILIEAAAFHLSHLLQPGCDLQCVAKQFNGCMTRRYERIVDFIKMHYYLTQRRDTDFWRENALAETAPQSLLAHLQTWRERAPSPFDFAMEDESFAPANYQFVLYGMGFRTAARRAARPDPCAAFARQEFARVREASKRAVAALPAHRELLERVYQAGFSFSDAGRSPKASRQ